MITKEKVSPQNKKSRFGVELLRLKRACLDGRRRIFSKIVAGRHARACMVRVVALALAMPLHISEASTKGIGTWVWSASAFSTNEARQQLVRFCVEHQISHLDINMTMSGSPDEPAIRNAEALRNIILLAGQHNITTAGLRGDPRMLFSENHERTLRELRALIAFYEALPADNLFRGITYDVEPYLTKEWRDGGESRKR